MRSNAEDCPICSFGTISSSFICDTCLTRFCSTCFGTLYVEFNSLPCEVPSCSCPGNIQPMPNQDFPCYEVHRDGRIYRVKGALKHWLGEIRPRLDRGRGYLRITLQHEGLKRHFWVHRLVCAAFHGEPPIYNEEPAHVRHLDDNRVNNHASNLKWGSRKENERDKKRVYNPLFERSC